MFEGKNQENIFSETLKWITEMLGQNNIPYMITGGSAVGFWGQIRTTMDIDIVVQIPKGRVKSLFESIKSEAYIDAEEINESIMNQSIFNIIYDKTSFKIDCIILKEDLYELEKFNRRVKINFLEKEICVITPEDLIISKLIWSKSCGSSERQIRDCESICLLNKEKMDNIYLEKWVKYFALESEFNLLRCKE